ncbi:putative mitochondrial protein [Trifolium repens]|nr:putative mitochondrial protein [Trifolium repens]
MAGAGTSDTSKSIFTNYVTSPLSTEKLNGSNYDSWAADIKLWVTGQGYKDHLTQKSDTVDKAEKPKWEQIDAQLCSVIKSTLNTDIKPIFRPHVTCESVWSQAKKLYTNDTQRLYGVCHKLMNIITPKKIECSISTYLGNVHSALHDFNELLPPAASTTTEQEKEREQCSTFFMLLALYGLPEEYSATRDQILGSPTVPDMSTASAILLRVQAKHSHEPTVTPVSGDTAALASFGNNKNRSQGGPSNSKPRSNSNTKCKYSHRSNHDIDNCWELHGRPPRRANMTQVDRSHNNQTKPSPKALRQATRTFSGGVRIIRTLVLLLRLHTLVTHLFASLNHLLVLGFLILVRLIMLPVIKDRSSGRTIGVGCESQGLYYLSLTSKTCSATDSSLTIHAQLGHPSLPKLQQLVPKLSKLSSLHCESCQLGKHTRSHFPDRVNKRASSPFALVHSDVWGPSRIMSTLESKYFVTFIDDFSRCTWIFLMKNRSELFSIFQQFYQEIKTQFGVSIRSLRSDNAREYLSHQFQNFMALNGILHQTSCPHTPQQNGVAERKNRHLIETTRTLLLHGNVPFRFWGDAVLTACYLINRMPSSVLDGNIPHSILFPHSPLHPVPPRVFGSTCFVHNLSPGLDKLSARSLKCVFLGYHRSQKGYRCYSPTLRRYLVSADVTFFESIPYFEPNNMTNEPLPDTYHEPIQEVTIVPLEPCQSVAPDTPPVAPPTSKPLQIYQRRPKPSAPTPVPAAIEDSPPTPSPSLDPVPQSEPNLPEVIRKGTRSTRNPSPHYIDLSYSRISPLYYTCLSSLSSVSIPKSPGEALSHPEWRQAMIDEMCALQSSGTWELVPLPPGKSLVGCRWLYTVKVGPDGKIDRFKARLVAKGYTQIFGLDYSDTFSPVAKMASIRLLLSIAAIQHWPLHQLDIKNAFLHGDLEEEVYMEQPPGFVAQGESSNMVCRLHRSLYGLKQSPRAWFGRFSTTVQQFGLIRSEADHSVFYRHSAQGCIYLIVYVDDIVITGSDQQGILQLKQYLSNQFQTKDLGKLRYFLGIEVAQSKDGIVISQRKYAMDILEETGLLNAKPVDTPMDPNVKLLPNQGEPLSDSGRYRRLVGKLNYLPVTRPGISFAVSVVSQFLNSPCQEHMDAVIRILKYIKGAPGTGLIYKDRGHTQIVGYSDADWAGSPIDRRSTSGYCVLVGGNLISWKSKKQNVVARSSAEAEYRAMALVTCELIWLKQLLKELQFEDTRPMTLICDNQAALHIASNPVFHEDQTY